VEEDVAAQVCEKYVRDIAAGRGNPFRKLARFTTENQPVAVVAWGDPEFVLSQLRIPKKSRGVAAKLRFGPIDQPRQMASQSSRGRSVHGNSSRGWAIDPASSKYAIMRAAAATDDADSAPKIINEIFPYADGVARQKYGDSSEENFDFSDDGELNRIKMEILAKEKQFREEYGRSVYDVGRGDFKYAALYEKISYECEMTGPESFAEHVDRLWIRYDERWEELASRERKRLAEGRRNHTQHEWLCRK
jgi:hypothetical protein